MAQPTYPLLKVFTSYSTLVPHKGYYVGPCPICNGRPAKLVVRPEQGDWHCYTCSAGGDAVDFLQAVEQLSRDQAYLLYKMLVRDDFSEKPLDAGTTVAAGPAVAEVPRPSEPMEEPPELATAESVKPVAAEEGSLAQLRERLGAVDGFRGIAYFGVDGKALLVHNLKAEELVPINAYFESAFRAAQSVLGAQPVDGIEGVLKDDTAKFLRFDAPVAGSRCRIFLALAAEASEARFRMVIRNFLTTATTVPR